MSYALSANGIDQRVSIPSYDLTGDFDIQINIRLGSDVSNQQAFFGAGSSVFFRIQSSTSFRLNLASSATTLNLKTALIPNTDYFFRLTRVGTTVDVVDEVGTSWLNSTGNHSGNAVINQLLTRANALNLECWLRTFRINDDRMYDATNTSSGLTLPETINNQFGSLIGYDGSGDTQWIDEGGTGTAPVVTLDPAGQALTEPTGFTLTADATDYDTVAWLKDDVIIAGEVTTTLTIDPSSTTDSGDYKARFSNVTGDTDTAVATIVVNAAVIPPTITLQPVDETVNEGDPSSMTSAADNYDTVQWYFSTSGPTGPWTEAGHSGSDTPTWNIAATPLSVSGRYYVVRYTGNSITVESDPALLTVLETGTIEVDGNIAQFDFSALPSSIDLTPEIAVTGAIAAFSFSGLSGAITLDSELSITGLTANLDFNALSGTISLQGELLITGETADFSFNAIGGVVMGNLWQEREKAITMWGDKAPASTIWKDK
jgi:hypothetical protein